MSEPLFIKLHNCRGIARAVIILLVLVLIMLVVVSIPIYKSYKFRADTLGCTAALKTAADSLIIEYLFRNGDAEHLEEARETLDTTMPGREKICPTGGTVYLVPDENGIYKPVCGIHCTDTKLRTRLNASHVLEGIREVLGKVKLRGEEFPESITVELNSQDLECLPTLEEVNIRRGTDLTDGYKGTVAFYAVAEEDGWVSGDVEPGEVCYFLFADKDHCAIWRADDGWTGDSYKFTGTDD